MIFSGAALFTVTVQVAVLPLSVLAVMVVLPALRALILPFELMLTIVGSATVRVTSVLGTSAGVITSSSCFSLPISRVMLLSVN